MSKKYNHLEIEAKYYELWKENQLFDSNPNGQNNYSIVIPPPNVTGKLHLGHAWDGSIQDIIIRYQKMAGKNTMWLPGMDHAGIATQSKVEERLRQQELTRYDLGRENFLEKAFEWKEEYAEHIHEQWSKLGLALDYKNERFTLDPDLNKAVNKVFVDLYKKGLIYQGTRIINWDPKLRTALSDIEVIHKEVEGNEHYFKYFFEDEPEKYLEVMTTRPETIFGDGALAVNPNDERYKKYLGRKVIVPGGKNVIPIIQDDYVSLETGSGVVKITPAHDPNDYEVGLRHNITPIYVMDLDGKMEINQYVPEKYQGMERFECRKEFLSDMKNENILIKIVPLTHSVGHSERSGVIVEPLLSKQWFVKTKPLAKQAMDLQHGESKINFYPERFEKIYLSWLENIQDWCISRQLWWGHQIPVWYHNNGIDIHVDVEPPKDIENYTRDEDVLDTWFSSALWPFATMGWPNTENDLYKAFYPTSTLVTGYDIIFFWVARMTMMGAEFTGKLPFKNVFIHGLIRDSEGRKMSKSLGNGIDPMDVIEKYGVDSLRYFLTTNSSPGQDLLYSDEKLKATWNYANKVYNVSNYIEFVAEQNNYVISDIDESQLDTIDKWLITKLSQLSEYYHYQMNQFDFGEASKKLYNFAWDDLANTYLEYNKNIMTQNKYNVLVSSYYQVLQMLHPFMPFVTDKLYQSTFKQDNYLLDTNLITRNVQFDAEVKSFDNLIELIRQVREVKNDNNIHPKDNFEATLEGSQDDVIKQTILSQLNINIVNEIDFENKSEFVVNEFILSVNNLIDSENEKSKNIELLENTVKEINFLEKQLSNKKFVDNAPEKLVKEKQDKLNEQIELKQKLEELING
jgi:valyl-tRNA synthetase